MDEDALKEAQRLILFGVCKALIVSHPDQEALRTAWAAVSAQLLSTDLMLSVDLGPRPEARELLRQEIERWTHQIHRRG